MNNQMNLPVTQPKLRKKVVRTSIEDQIEIADYLRKSNIDGKLNYWSGPRLLNLVEVGLDVTTSQSAVVRISTKLGIKQYGTKQKDSRKKEQDTVVGRVATNTTEIKELYLQVDKLNGTIKDILTQLNDLIKDLGN